MLEARRKKGEGRVFLVWCLNEVFSRVSSVGGVPEIRHKTAVSTIRSTAERAASRARSSSSKSRDDQRKKSSVGKSKETTRGTFTLVELLY